jgi:plastocyanin
MRRTHRLAQGATAALLAAALIAAPAAPVFADSHEVTISATMLQGFSPKSVEARTGTTVIWRNDEVASPTFAQPIGGPEALGRHKIVADDGSFESPLLTSKASWSMTFNEPGTVAYHCSIHPQLMTGTLTLTGPVIKPEPLERTVKIVERDPNATDTYGYDPKNITVQAGTTITWRNEGTIAHTVTADDKSFDSGTIQPGGTFKRTFKTSVSLRYHCDPHPWMTGVVRVAGAGGAPPPPAPPVKNSGGSQPPPPGTQERTGSGPTTFGINVVEPSASDPNSWGFSPPQLTARVGDTIRWTNTGQATHTVTADDGSFDSGDLSSGATFEFVLEQTGTLAYHCTPHPWMKGTLVIQQASAEVPDQPRGGVTPPIVPPPPSDPTEEPEDPGSLEGDAAAADRRSLAFGSGAAIVVLGAAFIVPVIIDRRRRGAPTALDLTDARTPVGAGAR